MTQIIVMNFVSEIWVWGYSSFPNEYLTEAKLLDVLWVWRKIVAGIATDPCFLLTADSSSSGRIYCKNFFRINYRRRSGQMDSNDEKYGQLEPLEKGNGMGLGALLQQTADEDTRRKKKDSRRKEQDTVWYFGLWRLVSLSQRLVTKGAWVGLDVGQVVGCGLGGLVRH